MSRFAGSDQRLYLKVSGNRVEGVLKVGEKQLFHREFSGKVREIKALCVLDFYVHESCQRMGVGKMLFEKMLECENIEPHRLAYDRPSAKLLSFLRKHYNLAEFVPQNNNFVIFNQYFQGSPVQGGQGKGRGTFNEQALHRRTEGAKRRSRPPDYPLASSNTCRGAPSTPRWTEEGTLVITLTPPPPGPIINMPNKTASTTRQIELAKCTTNRE